MMNKKVHKIGDIVYVAKYCWPTGIVKYKVNGISMSTGSPTAYHLAHISGADALRKTFWSFEVFDTTDGAFEYSYLESHFEEAKMR